MSLRDILFRYFWQDLILHYANDRQIIIKYYRFKITSDLQLLQPTLIFLRRIYPLQFNNIILLIMGQLTYADLLQFLGLSNWQFIGLSLFIFFLWVTIKTLWAVGGINKVKVTRKLIPEFKAVYISYEGSYDSIGAIYSQSVQDFEMVFKFSNSFAIYYLQNNKDIPSKAIIGLAINKIEQSKIKLFLSKFPMYKTCNIPASDVLAAAYPLINSASAQLTVTQVYPVIEQRMRQMNITRSMTKIMEIFHLQAASPYIDVILPIQNEEEFDLWYEPTDYSKVFPNKQK